MKALVMTGAWGLELQERDDPRPADHDVLVGITATGICGSDLHGYTGENGRRHPGQVMGHETVGRVLAVGTRVTDAPAVGVLVTVNPVIGCGECVECADGQSQRCARRRVIGVNPDISAAFAEQMVAPASNIVPLSGLIGDSLGALVEPLAVGYHAAGRADLRADDRVLVIGGGPIGQACAIGALRLGHDRVVVSDPVASRREVLRSSGFASADPTTGDLAAEVADTLGGPPSAVIDAVGHSATLTQALRVSTLGARVVLVGMHTPMVEIPAYAVSTEERTVIGSFCYTPAEFASTAAWAADTSFDLSSLVDGEVPMEQAAQTFHDLADGSLDASKMLVRFDGSAS